MTKLEIYKLLEGFSAKDDIREYYAKRSDDPASMTTAH